MPSSGAVSAMRKMPPIAESAQLTPRLQISFSWAVKFQVIATDVATAMRIVMAKNKNAASLPESKCLVVRSRNTSRPVVTIDELAVAPVAILAIASTTGSRTTAVLSVDHASH